MSPTLIYHNSTDLKNIEMHIHLTQNPENAHRNIKDCTTGTELEQIDSMTLNIDKEESHEHFLIFSIDICILKLFSNFI